MSMFYVYVLKSEKDGNNYVGFTVDLEKRLYEYLKELLLSTKNHSDLRLIYYETYLTQQEAAKREKYLITSLGKIYIKNSLTNYLTG